MSWDFYTYVFYAMIFLLVLDILSYYHISYNFKRNKAAMDWQLSLTRTLVTSFFSIMFIPIMNVFTIMIGCHENEAGELALELFPDRLCWTG